MSIVFSLRLLLLNIHTYVGYIYIKIYYDIFWMWMGVYKDNNKIGNLPEIKEMAFVSFTVRQSSKFTENQLISVWRVHIHTPCVEYENMKTTRKQQPHETIWPARESGWVIHIGQSSLPCCFFSDYYRFFFSIEKFNHYPSCIKKKRQAARRAINHL